MTTVLRDRHCTAFGEGKVASGDWLRRHVCGRVMMKCIVQHCQSQKEEEEEEEEGDGDCGGPVVGNRKKNQRSKGIAVVTSLLRQCQQQQQQQQHHHHHCATTNSPTQTSQHTHMHMPIYLSLYQIYTACKDTYPVPKSPIW